MSGQPPNAELNEALLELQQYLSDNVPPLVVADAISTLLKYPPQAVVPTIRAWTAGQYRGGAGGGVPVSDYLFHALKKIHLMSEFKLVAAEPLSAYLAQLKPVIIALCPEEDRPILTENLSRLGESTTTATVSPVQQIHRQAVTESAPTAAAAARQSASASRGTGESAVAAGEALKGLRRVGLLLERLEAQGGLSLAVAGAAGAAPAGRPAAAVEALAFAARTSQSREELDQALARLKAMGLDAGTGDLFRALAQTVPGWVVPAGEAGGGPAFETGPIGAMRRIITTADDPVEASRRFHEMVRTGVDRFNEGSLPQAVQMLELAERLVEEKKVDAGSAEIARRKLGDELDWEKLKKFAEQATDPAPLRKVLRFFTGLQVEGLLDALPGELKRDRRRLILLLLEIHGEAARHGAYERLTRSLGPQVGEEEWFFRRNLLYVLRRIPRGADAPPIDAEIEIVLRHAGLGLPLVVIKEAVAALGQLKDEKTEVGLAQMIADIEAMLTKPPEKPPYEPKDLRALLDRVASTLARLPSRAARRTLLEHAAKKTAALGDTMSRLSELSAQNLADDGESVDQILEMLKGSLPFKVLGVTLRQNDQNLARLVEALSGTPTPAVRRALEDLIARFPDQEASRAAARAIRTWDRPPASAEGPRGGAAAPAAPASEAPAASLQGDLEVFGLPSLLQSLGDSSASGMLTLREPGAEAVYASLTLRDGKLEEIRRGRLSGEDAFYQLLERPRPGQFAFVKGAPPAVPGAKPRAILPLTLEAMRRYDELQEAAALVPDTGFLVVTGQPPTPCPGEKDGGLLQALWKRASQGGTPEDFEEAVLADSYRIRRVLAHWVEQGALKARGRE